MGQSGQGKPANSHSMPYTSWSNGLKSISYGATSGGNVGADVNDAQAGGGGASQLANGGHGGAERTTGNAGG